MNRHSFLWPVAAGRIVHVVDAIPSCFYWDPSAAGAPSFQPELRQYIMTHLIVEEESVVLTDVLRVFLLKRIDSIAIPHLGPSAGIGKRWDVFQLTPRFIEHLDRGTCTAPKRLGTMVMHKLGRFIANHSDLNTTPDGETWAGMPMSFKEVEARYPAAANKYLKPQRQKSGGAEGETEPVPGSAVHLNPTVGGLSDVEGAAIDYRPTAQQCQDDGEMDDSFWPAGVPAE